MGVIYESSRNSWFTCGVCDASCVFVLLRVDLTQCEEDRIGGNVLSGAGRRIVIMPKGDV